MILDKFAESTGSWKKEEDEPPAAANDFGRYKSVRKSKRYVF